MNPLIQVKKQFHYFCSSSLALRFRHKDEPFVNKAATSPTTTHSLVMMRS
jgi:hypothetical protein